MSFLAAFGQGVAGSFVAYCLIYRETRLREIAEAPKERWIVLFVDLFIFLCCGGLIASLGIEARNTREAFMAGCSWQGIVGGVFSRVELQAMKKAQTSKLRSKKQ
jgi:hypothetical protein